VGGKNERERWGTALLIRCPIQKSEEAEVKHIFLLISYIPTLSQYISLSFSTGSFLSDSSDSSTSHSYKWRDIRWSYEEKNKGRKGRPLEVEVRRN
jgi:hypothetical protein